jgi:DNA repair protein RecO (recombination protein O)
MSFLKTRGIVIKEVSTGEADKIITLFSRNRGRISVMVKGGKRPKSKLAAGSQVLCYGEYVLFSGKNLYSMNSCDVLESFYEIRNDMEKLTYAAHFMDIVLEIVQENQSAPKLLQLLLNSLHMLSRTEKKPELISRIFELRSLAISGYSPNVRHCVSCGQAAEKFYSFSFEKCGFLCDRPACSMQDPLSIHLSSGAARAIQHIIHARMDELFSFGVSQSVLDELEHISRKYLSQQLERSFTKLDFLKNI